MCGYFIKKASKQLVQNTEKMEQEITLTTGIYDLIKDHIRRKKSTPEEEEILKLQLKRAKQVNRKLLPLDVVTVDAKVTIKDLTSQEEHVHTFVAPDKAKQRNKTESILSTMGLALVGYQAGDTLTWSFEEGEKQLELLKVERI